MRTGKTIKFDPHREARIWRRYLEFRTFKEKNTQIAGGILDTRTYARHVKFWHKSDSAISVIYDLDKGEAKFSILRSGYELEMDEAIQTLINVVKCRADYRRTLPEKEVRAKSYRKKEAFREKTRVKDQGEGGTQADLFETQIPCRAE